MGISNYFGERIQEAADIAKDLRIPLIINQVKYNMLTRRAERDAIQQSQNAGQGIIAFSPLEQGLLTARYLNGIPDDSRAAKGINNLGKRIGPELLEKLNALNDIAQARGQDLAQLALSWVLRQDNVCSVIVGASRVSQLESSLGCISKLEFDESELKLIEEVL